MSSILKTIPAAEESLLRAFESGADEDTTGVFIDGIVLSIAEEHWERKPGERIAILRVEAV